MCDLISVVIPVYNVEQYLARCLDSVIQQTYENLEIILVDDGSKDDSASVYEAYASKDQRIRIIKKDNAGLGMARNTGLEYVTGKYVTFVDSDDFLELNMIESLYNIAKQHNTDLVVSNFIYNGVVEETPIKEGKYTDKEIIETVLVRMMGDAPNEKDHLSATACGKLYLMNVIKKFKLRFPSERELIWEDLAFNCDFYSCCQSVYLLNQAFYQYCYNVGSLTHSYKPNKFTLVMKMYNYMLNRLQDMGIADKEKLRLDSTFLGHIRTCLKLEEFYANANGKGFAMNNISAICRDKSVQNLIKNYPKKYYSLQQRIYSLAIQFKLTRLVYIFTHFQNRRKQII